MLCYWNKIFKNDPREQETGVVDHTNPTHGELVEEEEETENTVDTEMEQVIDEMIDELNNEVIPASEEMLQEIAGQTQIKHPS